MFPGRGFLRRGYLQSTFDKGFLAALMLLAPSTQTTIEAPSYWTLLAASPNSGEFRTLASDRLGSLTAVAWALTRSDKGSGAVRSLAALRIAAPPADTWRIIAPGVDQAGPGRDEPTRLAALPAIYRHLPMARTKLAINLANFPKWSGVLDRKWAQEVSAEATCETAMGRSCSLAKWRRFLGSIRDASPKAQIERVNRMINRVRYRPDSKLWGKPDYWAAPGEFFAAGGDCEDFAIAKYYSLKAVGFPVEQMRILVVRDQRRGDAHAVLAVNLGGEDWVLDNLNKRVVPWSQASQYWPLYAVNERSFWLNQGERVI